MNRKELVEEVFNNKVSNVTKKDIDSILVSIIATVKGAVKKGEEVSLVGFGTFLKTNRAARNGVNPSTGEKILIAARDVPKFRPTKTWKEELRQ